MTDTRIIEYQMCLTCATFQHRQECRSGEYLTLEVKIPVLSEEVFSRFSHHSVCVLFRFFPVNYQYIRDTINNTIQSQTRHNITQDIHYKLNCKNKLYFHRQTTLNSIKYNIVNLKYSISLMFISWKGFCMCNKMKEKKYHTVGTITKSNIKIVE